MDAPLLRVAADAVLLVHAAFVAFVVLGGWAVLRWPRLAWLHLPSAAWGALVSFTGWICPLTPLELALRRAAGDAGAPAGVVEPMVVALLYPDGLTRGVQIALGAGVVIVNLVPYALLWATRRRTRAALPR